MSEENISFKLYKFDIKIKELEQHDSDGLDSSWLTLFFEGKDFNIKMVNALRRVTEINLPTYAFPPELITIDTNTTVAFNNDYMRLRLSHLPVMGVDCNTFFLNEKYWNKVNYLDTKREKHPNETVVEYYVNAHNNTPNIISVTTNDLVINVDGKQITPYSEKYPILLIKLRPNDKFKCHMRAALGVGDRHVMWSPGKNGYYHETEDDKQSYEFTLEGNGQCSESELLIRACKYLIKKLTDLKKDLQNKISTKQILPNKKIFFKLENEDHTLGELLNYQFQDHANIIASGLSKPDHLIKAILIKVTGVADVESPLEAMSESIDIIIQKFSHIGKLLSDMYNMKQEKPEKPKKNIKSKN